MGLCVKKGWLTCRAGSAAAAAASGPRGWGLWGASRVEEVATCGVHIVVTNGQALRVVLAGGGLVADIVGVGGLVAEEAPRLGLATGRRPGGGRQVDSLPGRRRRRPMRRLRWATTVGVRHRRRLRVGTEGKGDPPAPRCSQPASPSCRRPPAGASAAAGSPGSRWPSLLA